jgi:hypothetical protein
LERSAPLKSRSTAPRILNPGLNRSFLEYIPDRIDDASDGSLSLEKLQRCASSEQSASACFIEGYLFACLFKNDASDWLFSTEKPWSQLQVQIRWKQISHLKLIRLVFCDQARSLELCNYRAFKLKIITSREERFACPLNPVSNFTSLSRCVTVDCSIS